MCKVPISASLGPLQSDRLEGRIAEKHCTFFVGMKKMRSNSQIPNAHRFQLRQSIPKTAAEANFTAGNDPSLLAKGPSLSAKGCFLLALGFILTLSCCADKGDKAPTSSPKGEPPAEKEQTVSPKQAGVTPEAVFQGPGTLLPKSVADFALAADPRYFGPDNLYDLINGGAEIYRDYGLVQMVTADYRDPARETISVTLEIYDQGSFLGALGRMARFLAERIDPKDAGKGLPAELEQQGIFSGMDIIFYKNKYLVHLTLLDESPSATPESMEKAGMEILPKFVNAVGEKIPQSPDLPQELRAFPEEHKVARSESWEPKNLAGVVGLGAGFSARYQREKIAWRLFATEETADPKSLQKLLYEKHGDQLEKKRLFFKVAKKRLLGFVADTIDWTEEDGKAALKALGSVKVSIQ